MTKALYFDLGSRVLAAIGAGFIAAKRRIALAALTPTVPNFAETHA